MAERIKSICNAPGCSELVVGSHCPAHAGAWKRSKWEGTAAARGYDRRWRKLRAQVLERDRHACQVCARADRLTTATEVDHILPKSAGGTDDPGNLQAICGPCHRAKSSAEGNGARTTGPRAAPRRLFIS